MTRDADPWGRLDAAEPAARNGGWQAATKATLSVLGEARRRERARLEQRAKGLYQDIQRGEV